MHTCTVSAETEFCAPVRALCCVSTSYFGAAMKQLQPFQPFIHDSVAVCDRDVTKDEKRTLHCWSECPNVLKHMVAQLSYTCVYTSLL